MTRMGVDSSGFPTTPLSFAPRSEGLTSETRGVYRAVGIGWTGDVNLVDQNTGASILTGGAAVQAPSSGLLVTQTTYGGNVYLDSNTGTVRFTGNLPPASAKPALVYSPSVIRINTSNAAANTGVSLVYDAHQVDLVNDNVYWYYLGGAAIQSTDPVTVRPGRYVFSYNRGAAGAGQTARPYWKSMRLGIQLPTSVYVSPTDGSINLKVTGVTSSGDYYQVDPVKGRVYFTDNNADQTLEGVVPTITYTGVDAYGNAVSGIVVNPTSANTATPTPISLITEMDESAVPIDQPVNEGDLVTFQDPFDGAVNHSSNTMMHPPLFWMLWSSMRSTGSDLYLQTAAPRFVSH
jgi:hypothetical protein